MGKRTSLEQKRAQKWQQFLSRTGQILQCSEEAIATAMSQPLQQSLRINNLVVDPSSIAPQLQQLGYTEVGWMPHQTGWRRPAVITEEVRQFEDLQAASGACYVQNASSWLPPLFLQPKPGEHVLDMCAAPGGKTSHLAALSDNAAHITANDNSRHRLFKLTQNLQRLGVANTECTLRDMTKPPREEMIKQYDAILLDAPCSGEGLLQAAQPKSIDTWSVAHIRRLAHTQKLLLSTAWSQLRAGGRLVYSTCTMAPEENELVLHHFLRKHSDATLIAPPFVPPELQTHSLPAWNTITIAPTIIEHTLRIPPQPHYESFFVAVLQKSS